MEERYTKEIQAFGKRLRMLREKKRLSQLDVEIISGINRTEISRIESGLKNVEFMTLVRLATALEVELYEFFPLDRT